MRYELFEEVYSISSNDFREHRQVRVLNRADDDEILRVPFAVWSRFGMNHHPRAIWAYSVCKMMHFCHFKLKFYRCEFNNILSSSSSTSSNIPCCKTTCIMLAHNNLKNTFGHCMCMCLTQRMFRIRANRSVPLIQKSFRFSANTSVLLAFACFFLCFGLCGLAVQGVVVFVDILRLCCLLFLFSRLTDEN